MNTINNCFPAGTYKIRVRSYDESHILSEFSAEKTVKIKAAANGYKKKYDFSKVKAGDIIKFGSFEQDNDFTNGKEPIEWVVLAKGKKTMLVISKNTLTNLPYNTERKEITWENCTLRKWLNESFYTNAFNKQEKKKIKATTIENQDNPKYGIEGGKDTKDKIFLPSYDEMTQYGFDTGAGCYDQKRRATPTAYAIAKGAAPSDVYPTLEGAPAYAYWLRTIGGTSEGDYAAYVNREGEDYAFGNVVDIRYGVRPMMYISIK